MSQLEHVKGLFAKAFKGTHVAITPTIAHASTARWGYVDNDFNETDSKLSVFFAAVEVELSDIKYHPEAAHAVAMAERTKKHIRAEDTWVSSHGQQLGMDYQDRSTYCNRINTALLEDGWLVSDMGIENHGGGSTWIVRYSKVSLDNPMYCWQIRMVYIPSIYSEDHWGAGRYYEGDEGQEYVIVNYEQGELTNIDTHDFKTGELLRRLFVERVDRSYDNSPIINMSDKNDIDWLGRVGIHTHQIEFIVSGTRHTYGVSMENLDGVLVSRRVVVEVFDKESTDLPVGM